MRVLYVVRDRSGLNWTRRLRLTLTGRTAFSQDGFFEAAMDAAFDVTRGRAASVLPALSSLSRRYDALVVNYKFAGGEELTSPCSSGSEPLTFPKICS